MLERRTTPLRNTVREASSDPEFAEHRADFGFSQRYLPHIKAILAEHLIVEAPPHEDLHRGADIAVLGIQPVRIACRVREPKYLQRYGDEFTIRQSRPSGAKTELTKIVEGWGDVFFYGFAAEDEDQLATWMLGDLGVFRGWLWRELLGKQELPGKGETNRDGSTFRAFKLAELPINFFIASWPPRAAPQ